MLDTHEVGNTEDTSQTAPSIVIGASPSGYQTLTAQPFGHGGGRTRYAATVLDGDEPGLEGYLVPWYVLSDRGTYFVPGSLKRTAKAQLPVAHHLYQHWSDLTLGKHKAAFEDGTGFRVAVQINEGKTLGAEVMSDYRFGVPYAWSIGFDRVASRTGTAADDKKLDRSGQPHLANIPINEFEAITEARWWESSTVTWGAITVAGPDVVQRRGLPLADDVDVPALLYALRSGRLDPSQRRQLEALVTAFPSRSALGTDHGAREQDGPDTPGQPVDPAAPVRPDRLGPVAEALARFALIKERELAA